MSLKQDGYELEDAKAMCEEHQLEKNRRRMRIQGYDYYDEEDEGFIPRNNVDERL